MSKPNNVGTNKDRVFALTLACRCARTPPQLTDIFSTFVSRTRQYDQVLLHFKAQVDDWGIAYTTNSCMACLWRG